MANIYKQSAPETREVNLNATIKLPRERYTIRVKEEKFEISKNSGNPMIVLTSELAAPSSIKLFDGTTVNIAGVELQKQYITLRAKDEKGEVDLKKSQSLFDRYAELRALCNVPVGDEGVDIENPPKAFEGLVLDAICDGEELVMRKDPTPEQKARKEMGDPIKDANGKPIISYRAYVVKILGSADPEIARSIGENKPF